MKKNKPVRINVKLRSTVTEDQIAPFINQHEMTVGAHLREGQPQGFDALSSRAPVNEENIKLGKAYRKEFPETFEGPHHAARDFVLKEVAPLIIGMLNGLQDADDILTTAFKDRPDTSKMFQRIENAVEQALQVKIISFARTFTGLDEKQANQFMLIALSKELKSNESLMHLISKVLEEEAPPAKARVPRKTPKERRALAKAQIQKKKIKTTK